MSRDPAVIVAVADGVMTLCLNRPDSHNALSAEVRAALLAALGSARSDGAVRCVLLVANGKNFSAGGDLNAARQQPDPMGMWERFAGVHEFVRTVVEFEKPLVCAVHGAAAGGGLALALSADLILAAESARFVPAFTRVGILPDSGILYTLPRRIGVAQSKRILWSGEPLPAAEALRVGMIDQVTPDAELASTAQALAQRLAAGPTLVYILSKRLLDGALAGGLASRLEGERLAQAICSQSEDFREGVRAFFEKRPPRFQGR